MEDGLAEAIDEGKIGPRDDPKTRGKVLTDDFGWDKVGRFKCCMLCVVPLPSCCRPCSPCSPGGRLLI
jgi:hypothetical protein